MDYSKYISNFDNENVISIKQSEKEDITIHNYMGTTDKESNTGLNSAKDTFEFDFTMEQNITAFELVMTYKLYVSYISLTYSIDYSIC